MVTPFESCPGRAKQAAETHLYSADSLGSPYSAGPVLRADMAGIGSIIGSGAIISLVDLEQRQDFGPTRQMPAPFLNETARGTQIGFGLTADAILPGITITMSGG